MNRLKGPRGMVRDFGLSGGSVGGVGGAPLPEGPPPAGPGGGSGGAPDTSCPFATKASFCLDPTEEPK